MHHPCVEYIYGKIKHMDWITIKNDENVIDFSKLKY